MHRGCCDALGSGPPDRGPPFPHRPSAGGQAPRPAVSLPRGTASDRPWREGRGAAATPVLRRGRRGAEPQPGRRAAPDRRPFPLPADHVPGTRPRGAPLRPRPPVGLPHPGGLRPAPPGPRSAGPRRRPAAPRRRPVRVRHRYGWATEDLERRGLRAGLIGAERLHAVATGAGTDTVHARAVHISGGGITGAAFFDHVHRCDPRSSTAPRARPLRSRPVSYDARSWRRSSAGPGPWCGAPTRPVPRCFTGRSVAEKAQR